MARPWSSRWCRKWSRSRSARSPSSPPTLKSPLEPPPSRRAPPFQNWHTSVAGVCVAVALLPTSGPLGDRFMGCMAPTTGPDYNQQQARQFSLPSPRPSAPRPARPRQPRGAPGASKGGPRRAWGRRRGDAAGNGGLQGRGGRGLTGGAVDATPDLLFSSPPVFGVHPQTG